MTRKPCEHHISKAVKGILPNLGHRCTWVCRCVDWLLGSTIKGQGHRR